MHALQIDRKEIGVFVDVLFRYCDAGGGS